MITIATQGGEVVKLSNKNLDIAMANACINVRELSKKAGLSANTIFKIRNGKHNAMPQTIGKLARALGTEITSLIEQEG